MSQPAGHKFKSGSDKVTIIEVAAWCEHATLQLTPATDDARNTGGASVMREVKGIEVRGIPLSAIIASAGPRIRLLKLDCEGAEHAILQDADLSCVKQLCGESHDTSEHSANSIRGLLERAGFQPMTVCNGPATCLFWDKDATR